MSHLIDQIKHTVDATIPDKEELTHGHHPKLAYFMLLVRNILVGAAVILFIFALIFHDFYYTGKAIAYFCGAGAYAVECLLLTDFFRAKVPHQEMFMIYCFGPLYILLGISYIL